MVDKNNPYKEGTVRHQIFEVLKDLRWHCSQHEFSSSQPAKTLQTMRQEGMQFEKVGQNWEKRMFCSSCGKKTSHRRLISLDKGKDMTRGNIPESLKKRIRKLYSFKDEITESKVTGRTIEVDHRVPQIRWSEKEQDNDPNMSDEEIRKKFMTLSRENNLLKSRHCEKCFKTGKRQPLLGIKFFFKGSEDYIEPLGCQGCGWHNPKGWKEELNNTINSQT